MMRKRGLGLIALVLAAAIGLSGCFGGASGRLEELRESLSPLLKEQPDRTQVSFEDMVYTRPDMEELENLLAQVKDAALGSDAEAVIDAVYAFYEAYDWFYTRYSLADIHYSRDLTDEYWGAEYSFCVENAAQVDAWQEEMFYAMAKSPCRDALERDYYGEGFFEYYDGENGWDESFTELLRQEAALQNRYYELCGEQTLTEADYDSSARQKAQVLAELVRLRLEMADYWGYETYAEFAWDFYYYRDYTPPADGSLPGADPLGAGAPVPGSGAVGCPGCVLRPGHPEPDPGPCPCRGGGPGRRGAGGLPVHGGRQPL